METKTEIEIKSQTLTINLTTEQFIKFSDMSRDCNEIKQNGWFELCNNPNINIMEIIKKKKIQILSFNDLSNEHWIELCGKEHLTDFLKQYSHCVLNNEYIGNACLTEMCKTKNNLSIVKVYLNKLTKKHWEILFKNEHAMDLVKPKVEEIKSLIRALTYNANMEINNFIEDITTNY